MTKFAGNRIGQRAADTRHGAGVVMKIYQQSIRGRFLNSTSRELRVVAHEPVLDPGSTEFGIELEERFISQRFPFMAIIIKDDINRLAFRIIHNLFQVDFRFDDQLAILNLLKPGVINEEIADLVLGSEVDKTHVAGRIDSIRKISGLVAMHPPVPQAFPSLDPGGIFDLAFPGQIERNRRCQQCAGLCAQKDHPPWSDHALAGQRRF